MLYLLQSSQGQVPIWLAILLGLIAASGSYIGGLATRKKPSQIQAENERTAAEVRNLDIQSMKELLEQLRDTRAELAEIVKQQAFLREQVRWHEELSIISRQAAHAAINEIQRCVVAIRLRDDLIKKAGLDFDGIPEFEQKDYDEITNYQSLPMPPKRLNP